MKWIQQHIKPLACIGISIIGILIINSILFTHLQPLPNGSFVVHAHPYDKDNPPSEHNHSDNEIIILNNIALVFFYGVLFLYFIKQATNKEENNILQIRYINILFIQKFGRAPPICNNLYYTDIQ